jgi:hypothetical protein
MRVDLHVGIVKQRIEMREVRQLNVEFGYRRRLLVLLDGQPHRCGRDRPPLRDGDPQSVLHRVLAVPRRQLQDFQVFADGYLGAVSPTQLIVGHAEVAGGEQVLVVLIVLERTGLADQRVDHVAVVDRVLTAAGETRHPLHLGARVPDLEVVSVDHDVHLVADQAAGHRIRVPLDLNRAAGAYFNPLDPLPVIELARWQISEAGLILGELLGPRRVPLRDQLRQETFILLAVGEVAAAAQQERLLDGGLQMTVRGFDVAVLMGLAGVGPLRLDLVVIHQVLIACAKLAILREVVHRCAEAVAAVPSRHAPQLPQRLLEPAAECLKRLRKADGDGLPIRVREREVIQQVLEWLAGDRHPQRVHDREIRGRQVARVVNLREHHLRPWPVRAPPVPDPSLERPPLRIGELPGMPVLQPREQGEGPQAWLGVQANLDLRPDLGERILAGSPRPFRGPL